MKSTARANGIAAASINRSTTIDRAEPARSTTVDLNLALLRQCVSDLGYTLDALEAATGTDRSYIGKVLNAEKPLSLPFEVALPLDLISEYRKRQAEALGLIVVRPLVGVDAQRAFVAGALGLLTSTGLPARADAMIKIEPPSLECEKVRA